MGFAFMYIKEGETRNYRLCGIGSKKNMPSLEKINTRTLCEGSEDYTEMQQLLSRM
jgi:hypothetical protein